MLKFALSVSFQIYLSSGITEVPMAQKTLLLTARRNLSANGLKKNLNEHVFFQLGHIYELGQKFMKSN